MKELEEIIHDVIENKNFRRIPVNNTGGQTATCVKSEYEVSSECFGITIKCYDLGNMMRTEEYLTKLLIEAVFLQYKYF